VLSFWDTAYFKWWKLWIYFSIVQIHINFQHVDMLYGNWVWRGSCEKSSESVTWRVFDMMCAAQVEVVRMKRFGPGTVASRQKRRTLERFVPPVGFRWNLEGWRFLFPSAVSLSARRSRRTKYLLWTCLVACERRSEALSAAQNQQSFGCSYRRGWCTV